MPTGISVLVGEGTDAKSLKGLSSFSVQEESTPIDPSDTSGATGRFTVNVFQGNLTTVQAKRMYRKRVRLTDLGQGITEGIARTPSGSAGAISLGVDLRTTLLSVQRTAQPYQGTVGGYFEYLLSLVGITSGFVVRPEFTTMPAVFPGWQGDVWLKMKQLMAAKGAEVSLVSSNIVLRSIRGRRTFDRRDTDFSWSEDDTSLALSVEGYYYDKTYETAKLVYPKGGWNEDVQVYQVDFDETVEFDIGVDVSVVSVLQPVAVDYVDRNYVGPTSAYCVMGNDGLPIPAAQWVAGGGSITVEIGEDTRSLNLVIKGANIPEYAPFRIAATAGPSDNYSSLRIVGTGVFFEKHLITRDTYVSPDLASTEVGATVDSEFIDSETELLNRLAWTVSRYSAPRHTIAVRTLGVNRSGDSGSYAYPTTGDFDEWAFDHGWSTVAQFDAGAPAQGWSTIPQFDAWWTAAVADDFANQAFGNISGARTFRDGLWYRIRTDTIEPSGISYTAEYDTTLGDFDEFITNAVGAGATAATFDAMWAGRTSNDFNAAPLIWGAGVV